MSHFQVATAFQELILTFITKFKLLQNKYGFQSQAQLKKQRYLMLETYIILFLISQILPQQMQKIKSFRYLRIIKYNSDFFFLFKIRLDSILKSIFTLLYNLHPFMPQYLIQTTFKVNFIPLNQQYQLYRYMSLTERKTRHNQGASTQKTTIFDLLKKKKPNNLFQTVTKSYQNSHLKNSHYDQMDQDENKHQTKNTINYKSTIAKQSQSVTPARILFQRNRISQITDNRQEESIVRENNRKGKSFLSMISPIKIRTSSVLQQKPQNQKLMEPVKRIQKSFDYQRKNVTKTINSFKDKVASLQVLLKKLKHKSRDLALLLNPILDSASTENHSISKQVGQIKNTLKSLDILVGQACQSDSGQAIQKLHHSLQEYLKILQSQIRRSLLEEKANQLQKLQKQKEMEIEKLRVDLKKAIKDNELLMRKNEKIQNAKQQIKYNSNKQENTQLQQTERVKFKLQQRIDELSRNNEDLENKLKQSLSEIKVLQKQLKNERMLKEDMKTKFAKDIHEVTESKNKQLIEEIMRLKAQFNADLNRINQLHEFKEFQLANKLKQKDEQLAKLNYEKQSHKQIQSKIIGEANTVKQENINLKIQIDGLVADMHRMNEELYQHWIALKDIKVLTTRLGSFSHFRLIYQDIGFNDHLFL